MKTNREFKAQVKQPFKDNWGTILVATIIVEAISALLAFTMVGSVATIIVAGPLTLGFTILLLKIIRGENAGLKNLFDGFNNFGKSVGLYILQVVYLVLWFMLFIIPGIIKSFSYSMAFYILADEPEMLGNEAITKSREMMNGNKWRLFCLHFSFIGWYLLGSILVGSGFMMISSLSVGGVDAIVSGPLGVIAIVASILAGVAIFVMVSIYVNLAVTAFYEDLKNGAKEEKLEIEG